MLIKQCYNLFIISTINIKINLNKKYFCEYFNKLILTITILHNNCANYFNLATQL